jgi:hypothetical protein
MSGLRSYIGPMPPTKYWARSVELWTSNDSAWSGFTLLGRYELPAQPKAHPIAVGKPIRFIKLRILSSNGGDRTTFGEIEAIEGTATRNTVHPAVAVAGAGARARSNCQASHSE